MPRIQPAFTPDAMKSLTAREPCSHALAPYTFKRRQAGGGSEGQAAAAAGHVLTLRQQTREHGAIGN